MRHINDNPVKAGLVETAEGWPCSGAREYADRARRPRGSRSSALLENRLSNPSIGTLQRVVDALETALTVTLDLASQSQPVAAHL